MKGQGDPGYCCAAADIVGRFPSVGTKRVALLGGKMQFRGKIASHFFGKMRKFQSYKGVLEFFSITDQILTV